MAHHAADYAGRALAVAILAVAVSIVKGVLLLLRDMDRRRRLRSQARQLAGTGRYRNSEEVETAMTQAGREGASLALSAVLIRLMLDIRCALSRRRHANRH